jgi:serine/threonine protein kinase
LDPAIPSGVPDIWPEFPPYDQNEVNRSYRFSFLPQGFFSRLMVRLLQRFQGSSASDSTLYWSNGILMSRGSEIIFATMIPEQLRLDVFVRGGPYDRISPIFCAIIEAMSLLLREWGSISVKQYVLCSHCRRASFSQTTEFPIESLTASVRAKLDTADCVRFTGGLHPAPPEILLKLFAANVSASKSSSRPISPAPTPASPPPAVIAPSAEATDEFQKQMDDFAAQMEALLGGPTPTPSPMPVMPGAVALPGMATPTPSRPAATSPVPTVAVSPPPFDEDVEDFPVLNAVKQALMEDPNTICTEVRLDLLVPDLKLVYLKGNLVKWEDLAIEKQIGRGGFAIVYKGLYKGEVVAIKKLEVKDDDPDASGEDSSYAKAFAEFRKEAFIMTQITDPHCVVLKGVCLDPFALITEFVPYGDLYSIVNKPDKFPMDWNLRLKISLDMAKGMQFMHAQQPPIIHNDLKTPNVLMMSLDSTAPICAKVSDFGLSMQVSKMYKRLVDNPVWTAPEIMMGQTYTERADVYAYGVMLWELLERKQYFSHVPFNSDLEIRVMAGERSPVTQDCMPEFEKLIRMCWDQTPSRRPDFPTIVKILELMIKKCNMGLAVIGPSSEMAAKPPPLPQVAALPPAAASPKQMVKSMSTNQIARNPSTELKPTSPPSPGTVRRDRGPTPLPSRSPSTEMRPAQEAPIPAVPQPQAPVQPSDPVPTIPSPASSIPPIQQTLPIASAPVAPAATLQEPVQQPASDAALRGPSGNIRVAAIGGAGTSNGAIQSLQDQLKSNVKRAPSMSQSGTPPAGAPSPAGPKKIPGPGSLKSPLKQSAPGGGPAKGVPGQGPAPAKQTTPGPASLKSSGGVKVPTGGLKKGPAVAPAAGTAASAISNAQHTEQSPPAAVQSSNTASFDDPTLAAIISASGEEALPVGATDIETIRCACQEVETALKTGTLKSFGVLKILGGDEARESEDQVEKAIVEVVQLVRSMRTGNQILMEADTSGVDSAQFSRQEAASGSAQAVIDALLVFCRSAKALDGAQRGLLTANDVGEVDIDSVREQSAAFAAAVKGYLTVLRPIKEWFKNTKARFFFPVSS